MRRGSHLAHYNSCFVGRYLLFCCDCYKWQLNDFVNGKVPLNYFSFFTFCNDKLLSFEISNANSKFEILRVRGGGLFVENIYSISVWQHRD